MQVAPVFILGLASAPLSRLAAMLGRHPQVLPLPELALFIAPTIGELLDIADLSETQVADGLLRAVAELHTGGQTADGVEVARAWLERRRHWSGSALLEELSQTAARRTPLLADGQVGLRPDWLDALLESQPDAHLVHLVEHPWSQCRDIARELRQAGFVPPAYRDFSVEWGVIDPQLAWHQVHQAIDRSLEGVPETRRSRLRLEDLEAAPEAVLGSLCTRLGLAAAAEDLDAVLHPELGPYAWPGPPAAAAGAATAFLADPAFHSRLRRRLPLTGPLPWRDDGVAFTPEVVALARHFGYD
jgi:hypothetical protein